MPSETALRDIARCIETVQELAYLYRISDGQARALNHDHDLGLLDRPGAYGRARGGETA